MNGSIFKLFLLCTGIPIFVSASETGIATESGSSDPVPQLVHAADDGPLRRDMRPSEEISSPAHVILPHETSENERSHESAVDQNAIDEQPQSPSIPEPVVHERSSDIDALLLTWMNMNLNQSRHGNDSNMGGFTDTNCTDLSCLFRDEVTTPAGNQMEDEYGEDTTVPEETQTSPKLPERVNEEDKTETPTRSSAEEGNPSEETENEKVTPGRSSASPQRTLFLSNLSLLGTLGPRGTGNDVKETDDDGPEMLSPKDKKLNFTLPPVKTPESGFKMNFVLGDDQQQNTGLLPESNDHLFESVRDVAVQDIRELVGRCGVFPACKLSVIPPRKVDLRLEYEYLEKEHFEMEEGKAIPHFFENLVDVKCEPTSVSVMASFTIILAVIIIVSNVIIIIVTLSTKNLRKPHGYFKISLAIADLLNGAFVLTNVSSNLVRYIYFNKKDAMQLSQIRRVEPDVGVASFFGICAVLSQVVTVYSVLLLSVDSFLSVRWPMQYRVGDLMTTNRAVGLIGIVWTFAIAVSALPIVAKNYVRYGLSYSTFSYLPVFEPLNMEMSSEDAFTSRYTHVILYAALVWGIPFLATWTLTILTAYYSRGMLRSMSMARKNAPHFSQTVERLERDILRTVSIVLAMLTVTVFPMLIALVAISQTAHINLLCIEQPMINLLFAAYYVLVCGSFVNVIVYNACHKEFRRGMFDFVCDALTWTFSCCCPTFCDLSAIRSRKSFRSKSARGTTRTTYTTDPRKGRNYIGRKLKITETTSNISNSEKSTTLQSLQTTLSVTTSIQNGYGRSAAQYSDSIASDMPSSNRTFSTDTALTNRDRCGSSDSGTSSHVLGRQPGHSRSASDLSVFAPSSQDQKKAVDI